MKKGLVPEGHVKWYKQSASQNRPEALHYLARCYETRNGVKKHIVKAVRLYHRGVLHGYSKSYRKLERLTGNVMDAVDDVD